jgi:anthranilate synthase component 1
MKKIHTNHKVILADQITPVSLYLQLRDQYPGALLLESTDYHHLDNCYSFICLDPIAEVQVNKGRLSEKILGKTTREADISNSLLNELRGFFNQFKFEKTEKPYQHNGFFGYVNYDAIQYFEDVELKQSDDDIPEVRYTLYRYVLQFHHLNDSLTIIENSLGNLESGLDDLIGNIGVRIISDFPFSVDGVEETNMEDAEYRSIVSKAKKHIQRGDVFQIVLSRQFSQKFLGDEFNVYRHLRNVNPSPYLFYFDYTDYKLMGSSPEIQIKVEAGKATVNPIAGTFKRTGNDKQDQLLAEKLLADVKENAEHTMLVDLARNDLSRSCSGVGVAEFKEIQFYSHVIHIVSKVTGRLMEGYDGLDVMASTFPAGTLSGAPKVRAMQIIDDFEPTSRGFYGGCIGLITANGDINHAIMIRSIKSHQQQLVYQAGAGIVAASDEEKELQEVNHKIEALRKSIKLANGKTE